MMSKITIVIPAYNVGRFISRCVCSIYDQGCAEDLEIIIIDDGSGDDTPSEIDILRKKFPTIKSVRQANSGLGASRNRGLELATSDFVWFVDGDDFLTPGCISAVLCQLYEFDPDVLVLNSSSADENGKPIDWVRCNFEEFFGRTVDGGEFFRKYFDTTYVWLYLFKRELLVNNRIFFEPRINMQDAEMLPRALSYATSVYVSHVVAYVYVKRDNSFINNNDADVRLRYFYSVLEVRRLLSDFSSRTDQVNLRFGLVSKLKSINRIILLSFIYDIPSTDSLKKCSVDLRDSGVLPFRISDSRGFRERALSLLVNLAPIYFPRIYFQLRNTRLLRRFVESLSRRFWSVFQ